MLKRYLAILCLAAAALTALLCTRRTAPLWRQCDGVVWTTDYHIAYLGANDLSDSIQSVLQAIDASASAYNSASLLAAVNSNRSTQADALLDTLFRVAVLVNRLSGGAYDPTVMPLVNAWNAGYQHGTPPGDEQIDSILQYVGLSKVRLVNNHFVKADARVQLDFSSIAKGLACDELGRMLRRNGVTDWMVEVGGEVALGGTNRQGLPWHVSVDLPVDEPDTARHDAALVLALGDGGVATSGNYRKFFERDGTRYSHIINPLTGRSETGDLLSVTVVAGSCMAADAWATACMVMGTERTMRMMEGRDDLGVMTISVNADEQLVVWSNARFAGLIAP